MSSFDWDADPFDTEMGDATGTAGRSGSSFMARAQAAALDDDDHAMDADADGDRPRFPEEDWGVPEQETALQALTRHWTNEKHAPDILPAQDVLLAGLLDHIRRQVPARLLS
jgi:GINS complex subunit 4